MVNCVNAKAEVDNLFKICEDKKHELEVVVEGLRTALDEVNAEKSTFDIRMKSMEQELEKEISIRMKKEIEIEKLQVEFGETKLKLEKSFDAVNKDRESHLLQLRQNHAADLERVLGEKDIYHNDAEDRKKTIGAAQRRANEMQQQYDAAVARENALQKDLEELQQEFTDFRNSTHKKLESMVTTVGNADGTQVMDAGNVDQVLTQMVHLADSNAKKEKEVVAQNRALQSKLRNKQQQVIFLSNLALDFCPENDPNVDKIRACGEEAHSEKHVAADEWSTKEARLSEENRVLKSEVAQLRETRLTGQVELQKHLKRYEVQAAQTEVELTALRSFKEEVVRERGDGSPVATLAMTQQKVSENFKFLNN